MKALVKKLYGDYRSVLEEARLPVQRRLVAKQLSGYRLPYQLHLGCGAVNFAGWINIDADRASAADIIWDLAKGIPVPDSSCALIYSEHMLEHLTVEQGRQFLSECQRALQTGGTLRIAMPSLDVLLEKSHCGNWREQDWLGWPEYQFVQTRAEMMNMFFRAWGHQWIYDAEELQRRLREAGFKKITEAQWGRSQITTLNNRETRKDSLLICEARK